MFLETWADSSTGMTGPRGDWRVKRTAISPSRGFSSSRNLRRRKNPRDDNLRMREHPRDDNMRIPTWWWSAHARDKMQSWAREIFLASRQRKRALVNSKNTKNIKVSVSKWSSHKEYRHIEITNNLVAWKHGHVVACPALLKPVIN